MRKGPMLTFAATAAAVLALAPAAAAGRTSTPPVLTPGQSTAALGLDLLRRLPAGNLVLSPDSIATALAMAGEGARGATAGQIAHVLHLRSAGAFGSLGSLQAEIASGQAAAAHGDPEAPQLKIADGLFLQEGFPAAAPFLGALAGHFAATPQTVNFQSRPEAAVGAINQWVSRNTEGLIPKILASVSEEAKLVLANAVYLHAHWAAPFKPAGVSPAAFHGPGGNAQVPFMHQTASLPYGAGRGYEALELPYRSSTMSLMLMLPVGQSLAALQRGLSAASLSRIAARMKPAEIELALPRFHIETRTELAPVLAALGMPLAFGQTADFSGIDPAAQLAIDRVIHAADIEVREAGTVAAAATLIEVEATAQELPPNAIPFDADRPFLYFLRDQRTGAVLFAGRLADAAGAQG
jgi:serpin B